MAMGRSFVVASFSSDAMKALYVATVKSSMCDMHVVAAQVRGKGVFSALVLMRQSLV